MAHTEAHRNQEFTTIGKVIQELARGKIYSSFLTCLTENMKIQNELVTNKAIFRRKDRN